ncbi:MAG TPA: phosphoglycerate kinase [Candidatus Paceibacterota bacterium]|nr:phosphoglycerate kinase [Candidatus Paceibacterota bacterium]
MKFLQLLPETLLGHSSELFSQRRYLKHMKFVSEAEIKNKKVLLRVDFNVDLDENGKILSDFRMRAALATINYLIENGAAKVIVASHLGEPKGKEEKFSLRSVAEHLSQLLNKPVSFLTDCVGEEIKKEINQVGNAAVWFLENLRFHPEEKNNDEEFARELASLADIYVNDAFGVCHRSNASVSAITKFLPSFGGLLLKKELDNLNKVMVSPVKPLVLILGGAKISTKLPLIKSFSGLADKILLGGAIANTFLKANNFAVGQSLVEDEMLSEAAQIGSAETELVLPGDFLVGESISASRAIARRLGAVGEKEWILDIGPASALMYADIIQKAKTIIWNGPMGYCENPVFGEGTKKVLEAIAASSAFSVIGGGDTLTVLEKSGLVEKISFVSTGGGAMLSYLANEEMPGLKDLN